MPERLTPRQLREHRREAVLGCPNGSHIYVTHMPRRIKRIAKKAILHRPFRPRDAAHLTSYVNYWQNRDRSRFFHKPDKAEWGPGPWQDEPDSLRFVHAGLQCFIFRNTWVTGSLNGYVAIPPSHPWWGKDYSECVATPRCEPEPPPDFEEWGKGPFKIPAPPPGSRMRASMQEPHWHCAHRPDSLIEVHGGLTFGGPMPAVIGKAPPDSWGFGFDTGHAWDTTPMMDATLRQLYMKKDPSGKEWAEHEKILGEGVMGKSYKDLAYVRLEVEKMAEQIALAGLVQE